MQGEGDGRAVPWGRWWDGLGGPPRRWLGTEPARGAGVSQALRGHRHGAESKGSSGWVRRGGHAGV